MKKNLLQFPEQCLVGKVVPKTAFYRFMDVSPKLKQHFVDEVEQITWLYKLAPSTVNIIDGNSVHEIAIFYVSLKTDRCPNDVFAFIDKNLPRHVVFVLEYAQKYLLYINYKEWLDKDKGTFRITESFSSAWLTEDALTLPLNGLSLDTVYENFVRHIGASRIDLSCENLQEAVEVTQQREELERQIKVLKKKATHERQPQKKVSSLSL